VVVMACFVALFARLWYLQVLEAPALAVQATANRTRTIGTEAPRGRIFDSKGRVIVDNRTSLIVSIDRNELKKVKKRDELIARLADVLTANGAPIKISTIEKRLSEKKADQLQAIPIASDVTEEVIHHLSEYTEDFPAVSYERKTVRVYPYGAVASNILGYTGRITAETLKTLEPGTDPDGVEKSYQPDSIIGLAGVESTYEKELRGTPGIELVQVDSKNRPVGTESYQPPKSGNDIQLHIDIDVQMRAEQALVDRLNVLRGTAQKDGTKRAAPAGSVVVLDPRDGGVVALASAPGYDPQEFANGISQERYTQLQNINGASALIDRSITGQYAPGSTFKLVTATAALSNGLIDGNSSIYDDGVYEVGNPPQKFTNAGEVKNGNINVVRGLTVSSDVYFYWLGDRMDGTTLIQDSATAFGFDKKTGIDLPNESAGYVLTKAEKKALHNKYPDAYPNGDWYTGDNVQLAVGQNVIVVTPLQIARAYAAFANGGTVYQPHVVWKILKPNSTVTNPADVLRVIAPVVTGTVTLPPDVRGPIESGLEGVTSGAGTAASAFVGFDQTAFPVVGKTGTAQVDGIADTSLFASYGPALSPKWVVTAVMEESGFGAEASGEVSRRVYELLANQTLTDAGTATIGSSD
ncbi:MAG: penicillin-binding protein 2, partial [Actinobacteria bacterium]|nr:penicillin-binding protein 2 [Actinomycetota bacterium]